METGQYVCGTDKTWKVCGPFCKSFAKKKQRQMFPLLMHWIAMLNDWKHSLLIVSFSYLLTVKTLVLTKIKTSTKDYKQQL